MCFGFFASPCMHTAQCAIIFGVYSENRENFLDFRKNRKQCEICDFYQPTLKHISIVEWENEKGSFVCHGFFSILFCGCLQFFLLCDDMLLHIFYLYINRWSHKVYDFLPIFSISKLQLYWQRSNVYKKMLATIPVYRFKIYFFVLC